MDFRPGNHLPGTTDTSGTGGPTNLILLSSLCFFIIEKSKSYRPLPAEDAGRFTAVVTEQDHWFHHARGSLCFRLPALSGPHLRGGGEQSPAIRRKCAGKTSAYPMVSSVRSKIQGSHYPDSDRCRAAFRSDRRLVGGGGHCPCRTAGHRNRRSQ